MGFDPSAIYLDNIIFPALNVNIQDLKIEQKQGNVKKNMNTAYQIKEPINSSRKAARQHKYF